MAPRTDGLNAKKVETIKKVGYHADGGGLYLQVTQGGAKSWIYRYQIKGRRRDMGLGPLSLFSLAEARAKALAARKLAYSGIDPLDARRSESVAAAEKAARSMTFRQCAEAYVAAHRPSWTNEKHAAQWPATLQNFAYPVFGEKPVSEIDVDLVMQAVEPNWSVRTETANRLRQRIEAVLDWAAVRGYRSGENPARWKGNLESLLPAKGRIAQVEHHAALAYAKMPGFMGSLRTQAGVSARALEFAILTAGRTGEVIGVRWNEIDFRARLWTVPADRMKGRKEHRVPLSAMALLILDDQAKAQVAAMEVGASPQADAFVFPGGKPGNPLSNMALLAVLKRMKRADLTAHGFRSTFRDWAAEKSNFPSEVAEMALAHTVGDKVEAAYRRGDLFEKRRQLAEAWARFCMGASGRLAKP
ncbi:MAG TPA: integrase arm-type DNA-binding domain-containing protein [Aliidongia sp.]|uniref:tyrosine-type recombinase/integrase n=1 Tax=Aliidongia sp. TaxID=1914230 RepID=UPI002DDCD257|nr:integrase arm-type DNA-binding domain-containing protein [Aliidongia sp.]HEV2678009.1 integrase arm-type DNA-binding domain-containing protein [Aliidongia sp.]